ncbi:hypothetical protein CEXT_317601 [Caerostris extrusa]|uniref:Ribosomal protein S19 n=1 Tax=Caerostris extrusa TaxID=172846 RepID=A0AAV4QYW2_CAEEX|nr:hypothetical protein CEXT_317601 [Caerostris extrusa]
MTVAVVLSSDIKMNLKMMKMGKKIRIPPLSFVSDHVRKTWRKRTRKSSLPFVLSFFSFFFIFFPPPTKGERDPRFILKTSVCHGDAHPREGGRLRRGRKGKKFLIWENVSRE